MKDNFLSSIRLAGFLIAGVVMLAHADPFLTSSTLQVPSAALELTGGAEPRFLGDPRRDFSGHGVGLSSDKPFGAASCVVSNLDFQRGKWFRFAFRGLPRANFAVNDNDLYMKIEFFGQDGKTFYDA